MVKLFRGVSLAGLIVFAGGSRALAQARNDQFNGLHLTGSVHDFTTPSFGAWTIHGDWSLDMTGGPNGATFTATLTMERSDLFFVMNPSVDPNDLTKRNAHTHNVLVVNGIVTDIPGGFRVTGQAGATLITGNGAAAPFETNPPTSTLQIDITGGNLVALSNIALTFGGPAGLKHFGTNPIGGVVDGVK